MQARCPSIPATSCQASRHRQQGQPIRYACHAPQASGCSAATDGPNGRGLRSETDRRSDADRRLHRRCRAPRAPAGGTSVERARLPGPASGRAVRTAVKSASARPTIGARAKLAANQLQLGRAAVDVERQRLERPPAPRPRGRAAAGRRCARRGPRAPARRSESGRVIVQRRQRRRRVVLAAQETHGPFERWISSDGRSAGRARPAVVGAGGEGWRPMGRRTPVGFASGRARNDRRGGCW